MSYYSVKFGGHRHSDSREVMIFVCHVTLLDHVIRALYDLLVGSSSRYVTILLSFMVIGTVAVEM